jgi:hypothetical protein
MTHPKRPRDPNQLLSVPKGDPETFPNRILRLVDRRPNGGA